MGIATPEFARCVRSRKKQASQRRPGPLPGFPGKTGPERRPALREGLFDVATLTEHFVHETVFHRFLGAHEVVAFGILGNLLDGLASVAGQYLVETLPDEQDLPGVDLDVRGLALEAAQGLMDHHPGMGQAVPLALGATGEQQCTHARRLADAHGAHRRLDELHGVVDGHAGGHRAARRVDVEMDVLVGVLRFEEQQLGHDEVGHVVLDGSHAEDHPLLEQAGIDVEGTLAPGRLLHHHGHQPEVHGIVHLVPL